MDKRNWSIESKNITKIGKSLCSAVCGRSAEGLWNGGQALLRSSQLGGLLPVVPQTEPSLQNSEELKAPGPRVVQILSLQGTPPVRFLRVILEPMRHASFPSLGFFTAYKK